MPESARKVPLVIVTRKLPESIETRMRELFDVRTNGDDRPMTQAELAAAVEEADVLVPTVTDRIDGAVLSHGRRIRLIANFGAGVDHIDVKSARERNITVTNTPGALTGDTADVAMALVLMTSRRITEAERLLRENKWPGWSPTWLLGNRLAGRKLGIIGLGRTGAALARRARSFGLSIHYHGRTPVAREIGEELEATYWESLDQMLARTDIISVNCPHTPATYHLLSARRLELIRPHACIVNTARGEIIDENALIRQLRAGAIAAAGLDVHEHEPAINPKLLELPNVTLLPHIASSTRESRREMGETVIINIKSFVDGHRPPDRVLRL